MWALLYEGLLSPVGFTLLKVAGMGVIVGWGPLAQSDCAVPYELVLWPTQKVFRNVVPDLLNGVILVDIPHHLPGEHGSFQVCIS